MRKYIKVINKSKTNLKNLREVTFIRVNPTDTDEPKVFKDKESR